MGKFPHGSQKIREEKNLLSFPLNLADNSAESLTTSLFFSGGFEPEYKAVGLWRSTTKTKKQLLGCPKRFRNQFFRHEHFATCDAQRKFCTNSSEPLQHVRAAQMRQKSAVAATCGVETIVVALF
ncbi:hypothetical protein ACFX10_027956 [Malus domestica]